MVKKKKRKRPMPGIVFSTDYLIMGQEYEKIELWEQALKCYDKALKGNPYNLDAKWFKEELLKKFKS